MPTTVVTTVTTVVQPDGKVEQTTETVTTKGKGLGGGGVRKPNALLVQRLREHGQEHVLAFWDDLNDKHKTQLEDDVSVHAAELCGVHDVASACLDPSLFTCPSCYTTKHLAVCFFSKLQQITQNSSTPA
jgi:hypothetical protein